MTRRVFGGVLAIALASCSAAQNSTCLGAADPPQCADPALDCVTDEVARINCPATCGTCYFCPTQRDSVDCRLSNMTQANCNNLETAVVCAGFCNRCDLLLPPTAPPPTTSPSVAPTSAPTMGCDGVPDQPWCEFGVQCTTELSRLLCQGYCGTCSSSTTTATGTSITATSLTETATSTTTTSTQPLLDLPPCNGVMDPLICRNRPTPAMPTSLFCAGADVRRICPSRCGTCVTTTETSTTSPLLPQAFCHGVPEPLICRNRFLRFQCNSPEVIEECPVLCGVCSSTTFTTTSTATLPRLSCRGVLDPEVCQLRDFNCSSVAAQQTCPARCTPCLTTTATETTATTATTSSLTSVSTSTLTDTTVSSITTETVSSTTGHFGCDGVESDPVFCSPNIDCVNNAAARFWCPITCNSCEGVFIPRPPPTFVPPTGPPTVAVVTLPPTPQPSTAPQPAEVACGAISCGRNCTGECGWSRRRNSCILGGRTTQSELTLGPGCFASSSAPSTAQPEVTVAQTVPAGGCQTITCGRDCTGPCGWSRQRNICKEGARTTSSELNLGAGCGELRTTAASIQQEPAGGCGSITCGRDCIGVCGWSRNRNACIAGGRTVFAELLLGPGC